MIPTGPEHINREARVLEDVTARNDGRMLYTAGEIVRVLDVRPATSFPGSAAASSSVGFRRVTIAEPSGGRPPTATTANNLELLPTKAERFDAVYRAGGPVDSHVGASTHGRLMVAHPPMRQVSREGGLSDVKAQDLAHAHEKVAAAYTALAYALNDLREVEGR